MFQKSQSPPTFTFFGTMRLTGDFKKNSEKNFGKFLPYAGTVEDNIWHFEVL